MACRSGMTNYRIGPHRTTSDHIGPHRTTSDHIVLHLTKSDKTAQRRLQRPLTSCRSIPVVNHALAHSRKCLTYTKLGRPKKRWLDVVRSDCADMGLTVHEAIHLAQDKKRLETIHSQAAVACPCRTAGASPRH